jgi:hypothetical protein
MLTTPTSLKGVIVSVSTFDREQHGVRQNILGAWRHEAGETAQEELIR